MNLSDLSFTALKAYAQKHGVNTEGMRSKKAVREALAARPSSPTSPGDVVFEVVVMAYNRPVSLGLLLSDLAAQLPSGSNVQVWDDHSPNNQENKAFVELKGWEWRRAETNHGKRRFWKWVSQSYAAQQAKSAGLWVLLPDDVRLCTNFFSRCLEYWKTAPRDRVSLNLLRDECRLTKACWTGIRPTRVNDKIDNVGYTDGLAVVNRTYFEGLRWSVRTVPKNRWLSGPLLSSGVGDKVSRALHARHLGQYRVRQSLVQHVDGPSQMNPDARLVDSMLAVDFVDGEVAAQRLRRVDKVTASLCSIPTRKADLARVVASLEPQVDHLNVFLNGYPGIPAFLKKDWITVARSQDHEDRSDANKAFWTGSVKGYHFLCDDDLIYPPDYVERLIAGIETRGRRAVVGAHGRVLKPVLKNYYRSAQKVHRCLGRVQLDAAVHILGTGALAYHTDTLALTWADFPQGDMADIWFGIACQKQQVPSVVMRHQPGWMLLTKEGQNDTIFERASKDDGRQTAVLRSAAPWTLLPDPIRPNGQPIKGALHMPPLAFWDKKHRARAILASGHDSWDRAVWAAEYTRLWKFLQQHWSFRTGTLLDFGCGPGRFSKALAARGVKYVGCDLSPWGLEAARRRCVGLSFVENTPSSIPGSGYANIFICQVLQHVPDAQMEMVAAEIRRVCRPRARIMMLESTPSTRVRLDPDRQVTFRKGLEYRQMFPGLSERASYVIEGEQHTLFTGSLI